MRAAPLLFAIGCVAETGELVTLVPPPKPPPPVKMGSVEISPSAIDFGSVLLGERAELRLRVANRGSEPVTLH